MAIESPGDSDTRMDMGALGAAIRRRWLRIVVVTLILLGITFALLQFVPKSYESTAGILVENRDSVYTQPANPNPGSQAQSQSPDALISSQIELVKSRDTLLPVVRQLKLADLPEFNGTAGSPLSFLTKFFRKPGVVVANPEDVALDNLSDHLTVIRERDSALISVTVRSNDAQLAAQLANAIAKADVARRADLSLSDTADATQWLQQQIAQMQQRVSDAESKVADFKIANDLYTGANSTSLLDQQLTEVSTQITAAQERSDTAQSRATLIRGLLEAGQPIDGVDDVRNSVTIQQLMAQRAQLASQRAQLLATLLPSHPSVGAVTAQITATDKQIAIEGRRVADALDAEAKIESTLLNSLNANLAAIKAKEADATRQTVTLDSLTRESKADQALLESYMSRYGDAASRTDVNSALPDVRVVTLAVPSSTPSSPKTTLILGAVGFVSLALQIGAILFGELLSGRALIEPGADSGVEEAEADEPPGPLPTQRVPVQPVMSPVLVDEPEEVRLDKRLAEQPAPVDLSPQPSVRDAVPDEVTERRPATSLRSWFGRRARAIGTSLTAFEPPTISGNGAPEAVMSEASPAAAPAMATAPVDAPPSALHSEPVEPDIDGRNTDDAANAARVANLSADLVLGRARVVIFAAIESAADATRLEGRLTSDALRRGLSVARVDAGSGRPTTEPGITDLAAEVASFGDVVHRTAEEGLSEVPWGHFTTLTRQSDKPATLIEALSDLYEVVMVQTGCLDADSSLPVFSHLSARFVLVAPPATDAGRMELAWREAAALGYDQIEVIAAPSRQAEVA